MSDDLQVPTRVVHLPLSWDDPACRKAIDKYMTTVRPDAPGAQATSSLFAG
jgi:urea carboxylase